MSNIENTFISVTGFVKKNVRRKQSSPPDSLNKIYLSSYESTFIRKENQKDNSKKVKILCCYIGKNLAEKVRFIPGDLMELLYNKNTREVLIRRTNDPSLGYKLGDSGGKKGPRNILKFQMKYPIGILEVNKLTVLVDIRETNSGLIGKLP